MLPLSHVNNIKIVTKKYFYVPMLIAATEKCNVFTLCLEECSFSQSIFFLNEAFLQWLLNVYEKKTPFLKNWKTNKKLFLSHFNIPATPAFIYYLF